MYPPVVTSDTEARAFTTQSGELITADRFHVSTLALAAEVFN